MKSAEAGQKQWKFNNQISPFSRITIKKILKLFIKGSFIQFIALQGHESVSVQLLRKRSKEEYQRTDRDFKFWDRKRNAGPNRFDSGS